MRWGGVTLPVLVPALVLVMALGMRYADPGGVIADARTAVFDYYQRFQPRDYQPVPVKIIDIDDESIAKVGMQWPWPRTVIAQMVANLANAGAAAVAFDIVFSEPDRTSPGNILPIWSTTADLSGLAEMMDGLPDHDAVLAETIAQAGNVVTGFVLTPQPNDHKPLVRGTVAHGGDDPRLFLRAYSGAIPNLPELEAAASGNGTFSFAPDRDLMLRRVPLLLRQGDVLHPSLGAEALRVAQGARTYLVKSSGASGETGYGEKTGINTIRIGHFTVPTDPNGQLILHYTDTVPERYMPIWRVLTGDFDPAEIEGHILLVGTSASGLRDLRPTPLNPVMPGVEGHAQAIEQILLGHYLERPDWAEGAEWLYVAVLGILLILLLRTMGALWSAVVGGLAVLAAVGASWYAYTEVLLLVDPVMPSVAAFLVYLSGSIIGYLRTEAEKRQVRGAFAQYLSPALVEQLAAEPERLKLGGEMRDMTFLFCDVRGFTSISEQFKSNPQGLTTLINRFLTPMTDVILARRGTIDKYMGDCIMAFWNAPLDDPDHAAHACESALVMLATLDALNAELRQEAEAAGRPYKPLAIGIGLNSGECVVGNMGSAQRFDYSVLGDAVNLASRLEGQSKSYGVSVVIGEETRRRAEGWAVLELDLIAVKGKQEAVRIHALLGDPERAREPAFTALAERHSSFLAAYRGQDWDRATDLLQECLGLAPELGDLYDLYVGRIAEYRANPPGAEWNGVFVATSK